MNGILAISVLFFASSAERDLQGAVMLGQFPPPVPEQQMIGQLSDGVVPAAIDAASAKYVPLANL